MKFTIELVVATQNKDKYTIAGYLSPENGEMDLMQDMIESLNELLAQDSSLSHNIRIKNNAIIYSGIPITVCSNILKIFKTNLGVSITTEVCDRTKYIPTDCKRMFVMEKNRLFD